MTTFNAAADHQLQLILAIQRAIDTMTEGLELRERLLWAMDDRDDDNDLRERRALGRQIRDIRAVELPHRRMLLQQAEDELVDMVSAPMGGLA